MIQFKHFVFVPDPRVERPVGETAMHQVVAEVHVSPEPVKIEAPQKASEKAPETAPLAAEQGEGI